MTSLKRVVPADKTKYYPDEYDYLSSFGDTLGQLVAPGGGQDYAKMALIGQRGALANKYLSETEGQALKNKLTGHRVSAIDQGLLNEEMKSNPLWYSMLANTKDAKGLMEAHKINELLRGDKDLQAELIKQARTKTHAGDVLTGGRPPTELELAMNVADEMEGDIIDLPDEVPYSDKEREGAMLYLHGKPGTTLTDTARAMQIDKTTPGKVSLLEREGGVHDAKTSKIEAEQKQIETMTPLQAALLRGKTSVQLANVEKIIQGIAFDEAESMQTQQKLINEGNLAEARKNKVNVEMNSNKKIAAQKLLELKASTALEWAGVEKVISDIGNNDMISAMKSLLILEQTNTEKLQGDVEKQQIERIKEVINNLKAHGKQQQNESDTRVEKGQAQITDIQVKTADDSRKTQSEIDLLGQKQETEIQKTLLGERKDQEQGIKNYNLLKSGASEPAKIKTSTTSKKTGSGTGDIYADELAKNSAKYAKPIVVTVNPGDPDPWGWGDAIPAEEYTLQPTDARRLVDAVKAGFGGNPPGEVSAFSYLSSIAKTPKAAVHLMHHMFNWTDDKRDKYLESLEE